MSEERPGNVITISTVLQASPAAFDLSGNLPFSFVIWVFRKNSSRRLDPDPRTLKLLTQESILDIPYALKTGLISVVEHHLSGGNRKALDFGDIDLAPSPATCITIDSPIGLEKTANLAYLDRYVPVRYHVLPNSQIGRKFESGKMYDIRFHGERTHGLGEFPVRSWDFDGPSASSNTVLRSPYQPPDWRLRRYSRRIGQSHFVVRTNVPLPPLVDVKFSWANNETDSVPSFMETDHLSIVTTVTSRAEKPVTVHCYGNQLFIEPRTQLEISAGDIRPRILAPSGSVMGWFNITEISTGNICKAAQAPSSCPDSGARISRHSLLTLEPGIALVRTHRLPWLLKGLQPGRYKVSMSTHGAWWSWDSIDGLCDGKDYLENMHERKYIAPLMLEALDELVFEVKPA